jgi:hypothetical protein
MTFVGGSDNCHLQGSLRSLLALAIHIPNTLLAVLRRP